MQNAEIPRVSPDRYGMKDYFFSCECGTDEHVIRFIHDTKEESLYISVFLHHTYPWYKRIWIAVKYIFGYNCKYGHFDNTLIGKEDAGRLISLLEEYKNAD